jgi:hypothetical protein
MATSNAATTYLEHRILNFIFNNNAQVSSANFGSGNANGLGSNIYVGLATAVQTFLIARVNQQMGLPHQ